MVCGVTPGCGNDLDAEVSIIRHMYLLFFLGMLSCIMNLFASTLRAIAPRSPAWTQLSYAGVHGRVCVFVCVCLRVHDIELVHKHSVWETCILLP